MDETPAPRPYRHGNLPNALRAAARAILDEAGPGGRRTARDGAPGRRFGDRRLPPFLEQGGSACFGRGRGLQGARPPQWRRRRTGPDPLIGLGLAYVEFALQKRGLFRLMFGPILVERAKYPALNEAANAAFDCVQRVASGVEASGREDAAASMAAWGLVHGLSALFIDDLVPEARARSWPRRFSTLEPSPRSVPPPDDRRVESWLGGRDGLATLFARVATDSMIAPAFCCRVAAERLSGPSQRRQRSTARQPTRERCAADAWTAAPAESP